MDPPPRPPWHRSLPPLNPNPFALMRENMNRATFYLKDMDAQLESIEARLDAINPDPVFKGTDFKFLPKSDASLRSGSSVSPTTGGFRPQQAYDPVKAAEENVEGYDPRKPETGQASRAEENIKGYDPKEPATGQNTRAPASNEIQSMYPGFSIFGVPLGNQRGIPNAYWDGERFVDPPSKGTKRKQAQAGVHVSNPPAKKRKTQEAGTETAKYWPIGWPKGWPRSFDSGTMSGYTADGEESPDLPKAPPPTAIGLGISGMNLHDIPPNGPIAKQLEKELSRDLFGEDGDDTGYEQPIYVKWDELQETSDSDDSENEN
ncbi:uncharacterized protein PAC_01601 [Phialocephala subalpina]|uniref:Uncharacterized protein n=1 Tax=Phialocephala subalpina TaxID=576137 RepID=A0A1L7WG27_9HELO|nr:uncharacterized protein PAC_01601 [Phialocephala subalpina]